MLCTDITVSSLKGNRPEQEQLLMHVQPLQHQRAAPTGSANGQHQRGITDGQHRRAAPAGSTNGQHQWVRTSHARLMQAPILLYMCTNKKDVGMHEAGWTWRILSMAL